VSEEPRGRLGVERAVLATWLAMTAAAVALVLRYGTRFPVLDDFALVARWLGEEELTWRWLWRGYNDHRYVLGWWLDVWILRAAGGDHHVAQIAQVLAMSAAALLLVRTARRLRGRAALADCALPIAWLSPGHWDNWVMAFQLWLALAVALIATWTASFARRDAARRPLGALGVAATILPLPLLGAVGALATPTLALATGAIGGARLARARGRERAAASILVASALIALATFAAYVLGFEETVNWPADPSPAARATTTARFFALAIGPWTWSAWKPAAAVALALIGATAALLGARFVREREERARAFALLAALAVVLPTALAIGVGRASADGAAGAVVRYVTLVLPIPTAAFFAWLVFGGERWRARVHALLSAASIAAAIAGGRAAIADGEARWTRYAALESDVRAGMSSVDLAARHARGLHPDPQFLAHTFAQLRKHGAPPFDGECAPPEIDRDLAGPFASFAVQPRRATPPKQVRADEVGGREVAATFKAVEIVLAPPSDARAVRGRFGLRDEAVAAGHSDGIVFEVVWRPAAGEPRALFTRELAPNSAREPVPEAGFEIELPSDGPGEVVLATRNAPGRDDRWDRGYWADVSFR
jgi:hypothetical protein